MLSHHALLQLAVFPRIRVGQRRPDDGDGPSACLDRGKVGCRINPFGKAAHHRPVLFDDQARELRRPLDTVGRCLARTDDRDLGPLTKPLGVPRREERARRVSLLFEVERTEELDGLVGLGDVRHGAHGSTSLASNYSESPDCSPRPQIAVLIDFAGRPR
jgi:hypothetical protein